VRSGVELWGRHNNVYWSRCFRLFLFFFFLLLYEWTIWDPTLDHPFCVKKVLFLWATKGERSSSVTGLSQWAHTASAFFLPFTMQRFCLYSLAILFHHSRLRFLLPSIVASVPTIQLLLSLALVFFRILNKVKARAVFFSILPSSPPAPLLFVRG
jgi:hypothetical protein